MLHLERSFIFRSAAQTSISIYCYRYMLQNHVYIVAGRLSISSFKTQFCFAHIRDPIANILCCQNLSPVLNSIKDIGFSKSKEHKIAKIKVFCLNIFWELSTMSIFCSVLSRECLPTVQNFIANQHLFSYIVVINFMFLI